MHSGIVDQAVKRYRARVICAAAAEPRAARRWCDQVTIPAVNEEGAPADTDTGHTPHSPPSGSNSSTTSEMEEREPSISSAGKGKKTRDRPIHLALAASRRRAAERLEALPHQVLGHTRTFHDHVQYFIDPALRPDFTLGVEADPHGSADGRGNVVPGTETGTGARRAAAVEEGEDAPEVLKDLVDEVARVEGLGERIRVEILRDKDARHVRYFFFACELEVRLNDACADRRCLR